MWKKLTKYSQLDDHSPFLAINNHGHVCFVVLDDAWDEPIWTWTDGICPEDGYNDNGAHTMLELSEEFTHYMVIPKLTLKNVTLPQE